MSEKQEEWRMSEGEMQLRLFRDTEYDLRFNGTETKTGPQEGGELTKFMRNMVKIPKVKIPKVSLLKKSEEE